jgi:hypothetical protein
MRRGRAEERAEAGQEGREREAEGKELCSGFTLATLGIGYLTRSDTAILQGEQKCDFGMMWSPHGHVTYADDIVRWKDLSND